MSLRGLERWEELAAFGFAERNASAGAARRLFRRHGRLVDRRQAAAAMSAEARANFEQAVDGSAQRRSAARRWPGARCSGATACWRANGSRRPSTGAASTRWPRPDRRTPRARKLVEGYVQALRAGGDLGRAEDVAYRLARPRRRARRPLSANLHAGAVRARRRARRRAHRPLRRASPKPSARRKAPGRSAGAPIAASGFSEAVALVRQGDRSGRRDAPATPRSTKATRCRCAPPAGSSRPRISPGRAATSRAKSAPPTSPRSPTNCSTPNCRRRCRRGGSRASARSSTSDKIAAGAAALGWRRLQDGPCGYSLGWFRKAIAWSERGAGDDKLYSGLAQGLRAVGMFNEAEDAAFAFADRSAETRPALHQHRHRGADAAMAAGADERGAHRPLLRRRARRPFRRRRAGARLAALHAGRLRLRRALVRAGGGLERRRTRRRASQRGLRVVAARRRPPRPRRGDRLPLGRTRPGDEEALHRHRRRGAVARQSAGADSGDPGRGVRGRVRLGAFGRSARRRSAGIATRATNTSRRRMRSRRRSTAWPPQRADASAEIFRAGRRLPADPGQARAAARGLSAHAARLSQRLAADRPRRRALRRQRQRSRQDRRGLCPHAVGAGALRSGGSARHSLARPLAAAARRDDRTRRRRTVRRPAPSPTSGWRASRS